MNLEQWTQGLEAWNKVQNQAQIDLEQSELYIEAITKKIAEMEKQ